MAADSATPTFGANTVASKANDETQQEYIDDNSAWLDLEQLYTPLLESWQAAPFGFSGKPKTSTEIYDGRSEKQKNAAMQLYCRVEA